MSFHESAEQRLRDGDLVGALADAQAEVRLRPADARPRIFLFQLLCVLGQWHRALNQLRVAAGLDPAALEMAKAYREAIHCEAVRNRVFAGRTSPMILGEPEPWLALLIESLLLAGRGEREASEQLRQRAFDEAPTSSGEIDGRPFHWIADADSRLGPVLEAMINGRYYWVPFSRLTRIVIEPPADLRDLVWIPVHLQFENGGESPALVPARYSGSESAGDSALALARKTVWQEVETGTYHGLGQRMFATEADELPLLEVRTVAIGAAAALDVRSDAHV